MTICKTCNRDNDSADDRYVCSTCGKRLLSKIYNLATIKLALTITGWVCISVILSFMTFMFAVQEQPGYITIHNKRGGNITMSDTTFVAIGVVLLLGAGGILVGSMFTGRRISSLERDHLQLTGNPAVYDIRKPKPI